MPFTDQIAHPRTSFCPRCVTCCRPIASSIHRGVTRAWAFVQRSWLAVALFAVAAVLLASAVGGDRGLTRVLHLQEELDQASDRNFGLMQQISAKRRDLEMARSDDATLERLARRHLGMVRPGEVLYFVPPATTDGASVLHEEDDGAVVTSEDELD